MKTFIDLLEFFGGMILLFVIGKLIGYIFKLDEYIQTFAKARKNDNK
jgi:hypothetical protein